MLEYPSEVRRLNRLLESELGGSPRYAWRWSEDLLHVMKVVDDEGSPVYEERIIILPTDQTIYAQIQKTATRKLLPHHQDQWVACALVEVNDADGSLAGTGIGSWIPISSSVGGPAALPPGVSPTDELTQCIVRSLREERNRPKNYLIDDFEEASKKREKAKWANIYDRIRDCATAFYNAPGQKGHVSFPPHSPVLISDAVTLDKRQIPERRDFIYPDSIER